MNKESTNRKREFFINISLAFIAVFICFLIIEITLRLTVYNYTTYKKSPGPNSIYKLESKEYKTIVKTNSLNMRDEEIGPKKINEFRILCLGDSITFGIGVDITQTYVKLTEKILNKDKVRFNLINGGGLGAAPGCYDFLLKKGIAFDPDMVIVQIYIGNDFYDSLDSLYSDKKLSSLVDRPDTQYLEEIPLIGKIKRMLATRICILDFIWNRLIQIDYIDDLLFRFNIRYGNRAIYLRNYPKTEEYAVAAELGGLEKLNNLCNSKGIKVLFLIVPDKTQVFKKKFLNNDKYYYKKPNEIIKNFCKNNNIPYIDFLDRYEELSVETVKDFYYITDIHWTKKGHAYAAEVLASFIKLKVK
jgi:lysophospholipase L1-like esterase